MATFARPILGHATRPSVDERCYQIPATQVGHSTWKGFYWAFDNGFEAALHGQFEMPSDYASAPVVQMVWTSQATVGDIRVTFSYRVSTGDDSESLEPGTWEEDVVQTDVAPTAARNRMTRNFSLTAGNFAVDSTVVWRLRRNGTHADDDMADRLLLANLSFIYNN